MNGTSDLNRMLERQRLLMVALGIDPGGGTLVSTGQPSSTELGAAIGVVTEAAEVLDAMDKTGRAWKKYDKSTQVAHIQEEMADVLFFILELAVLQGLSGEDLERLYNEKYERNLLRLAKAKEEA